MIVLRIIAPGSKLANLTSLHPETAEHSLADELQEDGLDWITALRNTSIKKLVEQQVIQPSLFDERDLVELLFDDHEREAAESDRSSVVSKAPRSEAAKRKEQVRRTSDGFPVQSFQCLLKDLGTLCKNRVCWKSSPDVEFDRLTEPTNLQRHSFGLRVQERTCRVCRGQAPPCVARSGARARDDEKTNRR